MVTRRDNRPRAPFVNQAASASTGASARPRSASTRKPIAITARLTHWLPRLTPSDVGARARMNQWISAVNSYYYPYMIYHVTHERLVFPELGIASDEKVVAHALPKVENALAVAERQLAHGQDFLLGPELSIADFYLLPATFAFSLTAEGQAMYPKFPAFCRWRERMEALPTVQRFRAASKAELVTRRPSSTSPPSSRMVCANPSHIMPGPCRG